MFAGIDVLLICLRRHKFLGADLAVDLRVALALGGHLGLEF